MSSLNWSNTVRATGAGVLAGILAGLMTGMGARIAMRIVADNIGKFPEFTFEGTLLILVLGVLIGVALGVLFIALKRFLPGATALRALSFTILLLLGVGVPLLLPPPSGELALAPELLGKSLFGSLLIIYGLVIAVAEDWIGRHLPLPRRQATSLLAYGVLMALGVFSVVVFGAILVNSVFGLAM